mmetsp:Transcript_7058/g.26722  ORF Transcript_7058/g.26722 Transcript_7058/m.26722 type:complete len:293 (-) Transcript_7058:1533-2411(-)
MDATACRTSSLPNSIPDRNRSLTEFNASAGHSMYQSIVQQLIRLGNCRHRLRNASPTGDMHRMMCRLSRTRLMKVLYRESLDMLTPRVSAYSLMSEHIRSFSVWSKSAGTSPLFRMLLISSTKLSDTICVSVNRNTVGTPSTPVCWYRFFKSSLNSLSPYPRLSSIEKHLNPATNEANLVSDCLPLPPTPTSIAFPLGCRKIRVNRAACSAASRKNTKFIAFVLPALYSSKYSSIIATILSTLVISLYARSSTGSFEPPRKSPNSMLRSTKSDSNVGGSGKCFFTTCATMFL